ncbi:FecR family protein [Dysgonomonas termitidis]|uniref:FecR family protein n=1 Tax=Dysgonomonas termitidis TaxID=1516126 RepID=A0ABV9KQ63_9BACT
MDLKNKEIEEIIVRYLDGSIDSLEEKTLRAWIKDSEGNKKQFLQKYKLWNLSKLPYCDYNDENAYGTVIHKIYANKIRKRNISKKVMYVTSSVAAILILFFCIYTLIPKNRNEAEDIQSYVDNSQKPDMKGKEALLILSDDKKVSLNKDDSSIEYASNSIAINKDDSISKEGSSAFNQLVIPYGKRSSITFSDGTRAYVNAGTRLVYPVEFKQDIREIYVDGEIYIDVTPDKTRPFVVKTKDMDVAVLGTSFNVNAYENNKRKYVVLKTGAVKINKKQGKESILSPNQICEFDGSEDLLIKNVNANDYILWIHGMYKYNGEKLKNILYDLTKYYGIEIMCDQSIANMTYSGKLDLENELPVILKNITKMLSLTYIKENDKYIIKSYK